MYFTKCRILIIICTLLFITSIAITIESLAIYYNFISSYNNICIYTIASIHIFVVMLNYIILTIICIFLYENFETLEDLRRRQDEILSIFGSFDKIKYITIIFEISCCVYFVIEFHDKIPTEPYLKAYNILKVIYYICFIGRLFFNIFS